MGQGRGHAGNVYQWQNNTNGMTYKLETPSDIEKSQKIGTVE